MGIDSSRALLGPTRFIERIYQVGYYSQPYRLANRLLCDGKLVAKFCLQGRYSANFIYNRGWVNLDYFPVNSRVSGDKSSYFKPGQLFTI